MHHAGVASREGENDGTGDNPPPVKDGVVLVDAIIGGRLDTDGEELERRGLGDGVRDALAVDLDSIGSPEMIDRELHAPLVKRELGPDDGLLIDGGQRLDDVGIATPGIEGFLAEKGLDPSVLLPFVGELETKLGIAAHAKLLTQANHRGLARNRALGEIGRGEALNLLGVGEHIVGDEGLPLGQALLGAQPLDDHGGSLDSS